MQPVETPALEKIKALLQEADIGINGFERAVRLSSGVGSRILRGEYRPGGPVMARVRSWSRGRVDLLDWLLPSEAAEVAAVAPIKRTAKKKAA